LASVLVAKFTIDRDVGRKVMEKFEGLYTFGQPKCGNKDYAKLFVHQERENKVFRFVNSFDIIPRLPLDKVEKEKVEEWYCHHGTLIHFDMDSAMTVVANSQARAYEEVNLLEGAWEGFEKVIKGITQLETLPRLLVRLALPFSLNDHLPSDYVDVLQKVASLPPNQLNQIVPVIRNLISPHN